MGQADVERWKSVVISGDVHIECRCAESAIRNRIDNDGLFDPYKYMEVYQKPVGAVSVGEILKRSLIGLPAIWKGASAIAAIYPERKSFDQRDISSQYWHSYVTCAQYPKYQNSKDVVWRVKQKIGIDRTRSNPNLRDPIGDRDDGNASVIVVEHSNQWFIRDEKYWPNSFKNQNIPGETWLVLEWTRPNFDKKHEDVDEMKFLKHVAKGFARRTVIVVTADDLRLAGMRISRGLSWERTISDLYAGVSDLLKDKRPIALHVIDCCAYLVVSFGTSGAVILSTDHNGALRGAMIFDPLCAEGQWASNFEGSMSGFTRCVTAGVALALLQLHDSHSFDAISGDDHATSCAVNSRGTKGYEHKQFLNDLEIEIVLKRLEKGIAGAIVAARRMLENGFDALGKLPRMDTDLPQELRYPSADIAHVLRSVLASEYNNEAVERARIASHRLRADLGNLLLQDNPVKQMELSVKNFFNKVLEDESTDSPAFNATAFQDRIREVYESWFELTTKEQGWFFGDQGVRSTPYSFPGREPSCDDEDTHGDAPVKCGKDSGGDDSDSRDESVPGAPSQYDDKIRQRDWEVKACQLLIDRIDRLVAPDDDAIKAAKSLEAQLIDGKVGSDEWSILDAVLPAGGDRNKAAKDIIELATDIVAFGDTNVQLHFPTVRIGRLFMTGREEIESLVAIRDIMLDYVRSTTQAPLSVAVFGKPGSGKSFAINELADQLPENLLKVESRTFNLSQFTGPEAIAGALQQVRDIGLSGRMPLVFWDEFDSSYQNTPLGWLRYFLAPMQDGKFQDESMLRYVGRAIFVFAGGKFDSMQQLIEHNKLPHGPDFKPKAKDRKVPDFISRLKGFLNVPTLNYGTAVIDGKRRAIIDAATALRRAKLLRGFLEREGALEETVPDRGEPSQEPTIRKRLNVDTGVVEAFLRIPEYKFGARSMEAIVKMSALSGKDRYDRSMLPPPQQLALHVTPEHFLELVRGRMPGLG